MTRPVGQAVKTAASHAANMGSIPVRVTISFLEPREMAKKFLTERLKIGTILAVEKDGKERKIRMFSLLTFFFRRK